jgi:hypothetical protein
MPERRSHNRPESGDRRSFPRPPLWLNVALLVLALATFAWARNHRNTVEQKTALLLQPTANSPAELNRLRAELSELDLTQEQLAKELDGRMRFLNEAKGEQFYISIDTSKQKFYFRFGSDVAREADVKIGPPATVAGPAGKQWTFVPLKGAVNVRSKEQGHAWRVPEWLYAMNRQPIPADRPVIQDGLGKYVIFLPNGYVIHSQPSADSPLRGPKPGSFMVPEGDLAAIWPRISDKTRVYVF